MSLQLDFRVVELLFSRMCHDLVGPVGAAVNGVELLEEFGGEMAEEAVTLLGSSARVASRRLRVYRVSYGMAAGAAISSLLDLRGLIIEFLDGGKITLDWPENKVPSLHMGRSGIKIILNLIICAAETLPRGGSIQIAVEPADGNNVTITVTSLGQGAKLADGIKDSLAPGVSPERLDPRTVQAYFTAELAKAYGEGLGVSEAADQVSFKVKVKNAD